MADGSSPPQPAPIDLVVKPKTPAGKDLKSGTGGASTALTAFDPESPFISKYRQVASSFVLSEGVEDDVRRLHIKKKRGGTGQYGIPSATSISGGIGPFGGSGAPSAGGSGGAGGVLPPIGYFITQPRFQFGAPCEFSDTAEVVHGFPHKVFARWTTERKELSMGFQASPGRVDASTQTHWARQVNKITQYEPNTMTEEEAARLMTDTRMEKFLDSFVDAPRFKRPGDVTERLMTLALEQNETADLFKNEFKEFADEDSQLGQKADNTLKDAGTYTNSGTQNICAIDWHPSQNKTSVVAFCCSHNMTFDKWVDTHSGKVLSSQINFVNFSSDVVKPHIVLEGPGNLQCFQLNPNNPNIVAGGLMTGQVVFWDVTEHADHKPPPYIVNPSAASSSSAVTSSSGGAGAVGSAANVAKQRRTHDQKNANAPAAHDDFEKHDGITTTKPRAMSYIDKSHSRPVTDVRWLPPGIEISRRGEVLRSKAKHTHQFVTTSPDGMLSFWDVRLKDTFKSGTHDDDSEPKWMPTYSIPLTKPDRSGLLAATKLALGLDTKMFVVSEDGEVATVDWSLAKMDEKDKITTLAVTSVRKAHLQPCTAVERCPHFPDIFISVGDWSFIIWQEGVEDPIFMSPGINPEAQLVAARWSPTRAGVIITALSSGYVEIWDLMDQIHHHSFSFKCSESSISSLEFWKSRVAVSDSKAAAGGASSAVPNPHLQYLAVGDVTGRLRLLQMPKNLRKKQDMKEERNLIRQFFDREIARAVYAKKRSVYRANVRKEMDEKQRQEEVAVQEKLAAAQAAQAANPTLAALLNESKSAAAAASSASAGAAAASSSIPTVDSTGRVLNAKEQKEATRRRNAEAADRLKEEQMLAEKRKQEAEEAEEREYQAVLEHYKKQFADENFTQKMTLALANGPPPNAIPQQAAATTAPVVTARIKF